MLQRGWDVRCVVVCPKFDYDWLPGPTLEETARARGLPVVASQADILGEPRVDFVISYMYRYLVKAPTRALAKVAAVNFHPAPLPEYGGWAFYNVAILEEAREYGCTCHYMDDGFDSGPLLKVTRFPIDASLETAWTLERKTQVEMQKLFLEFCKLAESGEPLPRQPQDPAIMRYMRRDEFERLKEIPPDADGRAIERVARAFWYPPYGGAYFKLGDVKVEVYPGSDREVIAQLLHKSDVSRLREAIS